MSREIVRCRYCGAGMLANEEYCPSCGAQNRLLLYKKWWFWLLVIAAGAALAYFALTS